MELDNCKNLEGNPALTFNALQSLIKPYVNHLYVSFKWVVVALEIAKVVNEAPLDAMRFNSKIEVHALPFLKDDAWCFNDHFSMGTNEN